ncbi:MAG: zf-HC2 domain-containing protein [Candidatus Eisenbacteria bacterium]
MTSCAQNDQLQLFLDGDLDPAAESQLRRHLLTCAGCAAELALFERVFASLAATPLLEPPPHLTGRILERVLPSQVRRRWLRALGWGYGLAVAGSMAAAVTLILHPAPRALLGTLGIEASQRVAQATVFVVDALALAMVQMAGGWSLLHDVGLRLSPLFRAITTLLTRPGVDVTLALATVASVALIWWLRPRELTSGGQRVPREIEHASLLAL